MTGERFENRQSMKEQSFSVPSVHTTLPIGRTSNPLELPTKNPRGNMEARKKSLTEYLFLDSGET